MMNVDVLGRLSNIHLPQTKGMMAIFEGVINYVHTTRSSGSPSEIKIIIQREDGVPTLDSDGRYNAPVKNVIIQDNGEGFTSDNYASFTTSDTMQKRDCGGKGIGRFLWLKAFTKVHVDSTYLEDGKYRRRVFDFLPISKGVDNHSDKSSTTKLCSTRVELRELREEYVKTFPKKLETIAFQVLEHLLAAFIENTPPNIVVVDEQSNETIDLRQLYIDEIEPRHEKVSIDVKGKCFGVSLIAIYSGLASIHQMHYCAHGRDVRTESVRDFMPLLDARIADSSGNAYVLQSYVTGKYLDDRVIPERTTFRIPCRAHLIMAHETEIIA